MNLNYFLRLFAPLTPLPAYSLTSTSLFTKRSIQIYDLYVLLLQISLQIVDLYLYGHVSRFFKGKVNFFFSQEKKRAELFFFHRKHGLRAVLFGFGFALQNLCGAQAFPCREDGAPILTTSLWSTEVEVLLQNKVMQIGDLQDVPLQISNLYELALHVYPIRGSQIFGLYGERNPLMMANLKFASSYPYGSEIIKGLESLFGRLEVLLPPIAFVFLFLLMLLYWSQAAFFGRERYKTANNLVFFLSTLSLALILITRWVVSRHFPLSNLYESLVFLSLCFLSIRAVFGFTNLRESYMPYPYPKGVTKGGVGHVRGRKGISTIISPTQNQVLPEQDAEEKASLLGLGLGVVLAPLSLLTFGFAFLSLPKEMQQSTALVPALQSNWLMMHVTVMVLSYAALVSGSVLSIAFLILSYIERSSPLYRKGSSGTLSYSENREHGLPVQIFDPPVKDLYNIGSEKKVDTKKQSSAFCKGKNLGDNCKSTICKPSPFGVGHGLSLQENSSITSRLDNYSYRVLALGFPLLTIGILSGAVWANEAWGSYWSWDPKETWALITWLVFAIYLHTRITKGWIGRKSAIVASAGFFVVWFCYLGVNLLGTGLHSYGWFSN